VVGFGAWIVWQLALLLWQVAVAVWRALRSNEEVA